MDNEQLTMYLENVTCTEDLEGAVELSSDKLKALVTFQSQVNLEEVQARIAKKPNMKIIVAACPMLDKVVIKNLRRSVHNEELALYFEDKRKCPSGGDVVDVKMYDNMTAVVQFQNNFVAERVVQSTHPYLGSNVEVWLWRPIDDVEDLKVVPAAESVSVIVSSVAASDYPDPVVYCVKKQPDLIQRMESSDGSRSDEDKSTAHALGEKPPISNPGLQIGSPAVPSRSKPRQLATHLTSDASHTKYFQITANTEVQFSLLKRLLGNGFAREHRCGYTADDGKWTVTISSQHEEGINVLVEQLYGYINNGTSESEVPVSPDLSQLLYDKKKQWLCDRLCRKVNEPAELRMNGRHHLAVVAFSENVASEAAETLRTSLLRGKVPVMEYQCTLVTSAKFRKILNKMQANKAIVVSTGTREITVDGFPSDVVCAVSEINHCLYKQ